MLKLTCEKCGKHGLTYGIDILRCYAHRLACSVPGCDRQAGLFSPAGYLCSAHSQAAYAIETHGAYPSNAAIRQVITATTTEALADDPCTARKGRCSPRAGSSPAVAA